MQQGSQRGDQLGLGQAGDTLQDAVPPGEQGDEDLLDLIVQPDDDVGQPCPKRAERRLEFPGRGHVRGRVLVFLHVVARFPSADRLRLAAPFMGLGSFGISSLSQALCFSRPPDRKNYYGFENLPDLAIREGQWKLLCDYDGSRPLLYDLNADPGEENNLADKHPERVAAMSKQVTEWYQRVTPK